MAKTVGEKTQRPRSKRARTRPQQASGRVARALWTRVAELRAEGRSATDIASEIARDPSAVARTLKDPEVVAMIDQIQRERRALVDQDLKAAARRALETVVRLMDEADSDAVQLRAAQDVLDRCGIIAPKQLEVSGRDGGPVQVSAVSLSDLSQFSVEQIRALAVVSAEAARDAFDGDGGA